MDQIDARKMLGKQSGVPRRTESLGKDDYMGLDLVDWYDARIIKVPNELKI